MADQISKWLATLEALTPEQLAAAGLTAEDVAAAKKEHLLERDYTQKSQRVASLTKIQEKYPQFTPEQQDQLIAWYTANPDEIKRLWDNRDRLVERQPEPERKLASGERRKWREAEAGDLYETARLREIFEDLQQDTTETTLKRWKDEYQKSEIPRLDGVANGLASTVLDWVDFALEDALVASRDPKHTRLPPLDVLKAGAARGERDFRKVAQAIRDERAEALKPVEDEAYRRGLEEGAKRAEGPSGPLGGGRPGWRPESPEPAPKTSAELFERVVRAVEHKSGRPVPI